MIDIQVRAAELRCEFHAQVSAAPKIPEYVEPPVTNNPDPRTGTRRKRTRNARSHADG